MPVFQRISDVIAANLSDLIDQFEDPEKMLRQAVREMEQAVSGALDRAVTAVAQEKLLTRQLEENRRQAERWQQRAVQSIEAGDDPLARQAISRRIQQEKVVRALEDQQAAASEVSSRLRRQIEGLRAKLAETQRTLSTLAARKRVAEARNKLVALSPSANGAAVFSNVDRWTERMELAEAEADAWFELTGADDGDPFNDLDDVALDQELAALKLSLSK